MELGKQTVIDDDVLANDFRGPGLVRLSEHLLAVSRSGIRGRVAPVVADNQVINVHPVAEALRNVAFHGDFTRGGAGLPRPAARQAWTQCLSLAMLDTVEVDFKAWVMARDCQRSLAAWGQIMEKVAMERPTPIQVLRLMRM